RAIQSLVSSCAHSYPSLADLSAKNTILAAFYGHGFGCDPYKSAGDYALPLLTSRLCRGFCAKMPLARGCQQPPGQQTRLSILMSAAGARPESRFELSAHR